MKVSKKGQLPMCTTCIKSFLEKNSSIFILSSGKGCTLKLTDAPQMNQ